MREPASNKKHQSSEPLIVLGTKVIRVLHSTHYIIENQMEKKMENEMEAGII